MPNPVVHFEIMGQNAKRTQEYYANLFGWDVDANNPMDYGLATTKDGELGINGGLGGDQGGGDQGGGARVSVYAQVDDLQKYLDKAVELGGQVLMPVAEVPGAGVTIALFADPDGNVIGLMKG
ncbi:MAG: VOC family protein [Dehalococcoidia bacterium]